MFTLRNYFAATVAAGVILGISSPALAGSHDCGKGPPSWWNAPRVSYIHHGSSSRSFSASRSNAVTRQSGSAGRYAQSGHQRWR